MRIFIYTRKSKFTGKGESIENQTELCREYISTHIQGSREDDITVFEDEGFSGKNTTRPQFRQMMELVRTTPVDYIVCYRLDRISRNVGDFSSLIDELNDLKVSFICIKEQFDTSTPMGRAMMYIASVFAQLERETIAERVRDNMYMLARSGRWLGGITPTGFRSEQEQKIALDDKLRTSFKLIPIPSELELVKLVFETFLKQESIAGTTKYLNEHGFRSKMKNEFGTESVKAILRNPVYAIADAQSKQYFIDRGAQICFTEEDCDGIQGFMPFNRSYKGKHGRVPKEISEWIIAVGKHKGIVAGRDWVHIQNLLDEKRINAKNNAPSPISSALLSGILRCSECGNRMRPRIFTNYIKKDGNPAFYYTCATKDSSKTKKCTVKNANGYELEEAVCSVLRSYNSPTSPIYPQLLQLRNELGTSKDPFIERQKTLDETVKTNQSKIQNLINAIAGGDTDPLVIECIKEQIKELQAESENKTKEISALALKRVEMAGSKSRLARIEKALASFETLLDSAAPIEKKALLTAIITRIEWDGETAHIYL